MRKNIELAIYGAAIGDFCGSFFEGSEYKPRTLEESVPVEGVFTDDTKMTCAVANSIMETFKNGKNIFYKNKLKENAISEMKRIGRKYDGGYGGSFRRWLWSDFSKPYNSFGNGACMRVSPAALCANTLHDAVSFAECVTSVTHNHPQSIEYARITASIIFFIKEHENATKEDVWNFLKETCKSMNSDCYQTVRKLDLEELHKNYEFDITCRGSVPVALYCFLSSESFGDCIKRCIYVGGDVDTIAAIACSLAAPFYGDEQVLRFMPIFKNCHDDLLEIMRKFSKTYLCIKNDN